jgi:hypothetical protein
MFQMEERTTAAMWCPLFFKGCNGFLIILTKIMEMDFQGDEEILKEIHREEFLNANGWGFDIEADHIGLIHPLDMSIA